MGDIYRVVCNGCGFDFEVRLNCRDWMADRKGVNYCPFCASDSVKTVVCMKADCMKLHTLLEEVGG
jgi:hypothetical protein